MFFLGLDIGSLTCDAVVIDSEGAVVSWCVVPTGARNTDAIAAAHRGVLDAASIQSDDVCAVVSTGYGRDRVESRLAAVTEITCHARGIQKQLPGTELLIDVGGQDSKAVHLDGAGNVVDFAMNDKCAAGTGRFLEAMARALDMGIAELAAQDRRARRELEISNMCTVFAESEVVSLIAAGAEVPDIVRGIHRAVASRVQVLARRLIKNVSSKQVAMSGGVARNGAVVKALSEALECEVAVPREPDTVGALGAALIAREKHLQQR